MGRLEAALDAIGVAAAIVDASGRVIQANAAARELFAAEALLARDLADAMARSMTEGDSPWAITPIDTEPDAPREYLLVLRAGGEGALRNQVRAACDRWSLSQRKREVLSMVVEGHSNQTIASALDISLRTVEVHVTDLLDKSGAGSRSALSARVFTLR